MLPRTRSLEFLFPGNKSFWGVGAKVLGSFVLGSDFRYWEQKSFPGTRVPGREEKFHDKELLFLQAKVLSSSCTVSSKVTVYSQYYTHLCVHTACHCRRYKLVLKCIDWQTVKYGRLLSKTRRWLTEGKGRARFMEHFGSVSALCALCI